MGVQGGSMEGLLGGYWAVVEGLLRGIMKGLPARHNCISHHTNLNNWSPPDI